MEEHEPEMPKADGLSESALVAGARTGDEAALRRLFERHEALLRGRIRGRLSPPVRRKVSDSDVLQETWIIATRRLGDFEYRGEGSFGAWIGRIADHTTLKAVRRHAGTAKRNVGTEVTRGARADTAQFAGIQPTASRTAMAREMRERMAAAMADLQPDHRTVIELLQHRRVTIAEATELMGRSANAIKKLHARALAELAKRLDLRGRGGDDGR